jgi:hypothetical protein
MKLSTLLLTGSLVANGALALALVLGSPAPKAPVSSVSTPASRATPPVAAAVAPAVTAAPVVGTVGMPAATLWSRLHAGDLGEFNRRLRAAGFSPREVRALLAMAINDEIQARREALLGRPEDTPYWKYPALSATDPERRAQLDEISREARALNYQYLGGPVSLAEDEDLLNFAKRRYGNLPLEKLQQITELQHDFEEMQMQGIGARRDEASARAFMEAMRALEREHFAEVAQLLTPAELEQYELRNNAGGLRMRLATFRPTEEEFKALYALEKQRTTGTAPDQLLAQAEAALGAGRFAEYTMTMTSDGTGQLGRLMARLELPLTTITTINTVRDDLSARALVLTNDPALTAAQRESRFAMLAQEADEKLTSTLGQRGYEAYKDLKGDWIRALKPRTGTGGP